eukprot:gene31119-40468_t
MDGREPTRCCCGTTTCRVMTPSEIEELKNNNNIFKAKRKLKYLFDDSDDIESAQESRDVAMHSMSDFAHSPLDSGSGKKIFDQKGFTIPEDLVGMRIKVDRPLVVFVVRRFGDAHETLGVNPFEDFCTYIINTFHIKAILKDSNALSGQGEVSVHTREVVLFGDIVNINRCRYEIAIANRLMSQEIYAQ